MSRLNLFPLPALRLLVYLLGLLFGLNPLIALAETPRVSVVPPPTTIRVGQTFPLEVEIRWRGEGGDIQVLGLKTGGGEQIQQGAAEHQQQTHSGETLHTIKMELVANLPGEVDLAPVTLTFRDAAGSTQTLDIPGSWVVQVLPPSSVAGRVLPAGLVALLTLGVWWWRRREKVPAPVSPHPPRVSSSELLEQARMALDQGRGEQVLQLLVQLKPLLPPAEDLLPSAELLEQERMKLRYGGYDADTVQLGRWLRSVEVTLTRTQTP